MVKVKLLMIEGMDRAGKDTLAYELERQTYTKNIKLNIFGPINHDTYYDVNRTMLGSAKSPYFKNVVGEAMAISEYMQVLSHVLDYRRTAFVMARSFVSTVVYDWVRGLGRTGLSDTIYEMTKVFEAKNNIKLDLRLLKLYVSKSEQRARGSTEDSFEQLNYDKILECFNAYNNTLLFDRILTIDTSNMRQDDVLKEAETFLFTG
jgi:thymidylate kinase